MSDNEQNSIFREVGVLFQPLTRLDSPYKVTALFKALGYELPDGDSFPDFPGLATRMESVIAAITKYDKAAEGDAKTDALAELAFEIVQLSAEIVKLTTDITSAVAAYPTFIANAELDKLPKRLIDYLIIEYTRNFRPQVHAIISILGIFEEESLVEDDSIHQPATTLQVIYWERIATLLSDPIGLFDEVYNWSVDFDSEKLFEKVETILRAFLLPGGLYSQSATVQAALENPTASLPELRFPLFQSGTIRPETYNQFGLNITSLEADGGLKPGFALMPYILGSASFDFDVNDDFEVTLDISGSIDAGIGLLVRPSEVSFLDTIYSAPGDAGNLNADLRLSQKEESGELLIFGSEGQTRLALEGSEIKVFASHGETKDMGFEISLDALRLVIAGGDGDGFLSTILGEDGVTAEAGFTIGYSIQNGFYFRGSGGLEIQLPTHISLGPLEIQALKLAIKFADGTIIIEGGANVSVALGPLVAVVENIGLTATVSFPDEGGNLGPANLELGFKPPNGLGLSLDASVVKGGGYLYFDRDKEEYAGALELTISDFLSLKAIGVVTTRMPDGSKGFSLLIIISAEFTIQLGYGFVFLGAGGLVGLNRTMELEPLAEGVRTGATANIMFPSNVVENAMQIISDLNEFFPPEQDKFLIGPMIKLGWGTPALISISLGVIIEIDTSEGFSIERIAILGVLKCILPDEAAAVLVLQVNFIGAIDFEEKTAFFFASIFESRVLFITIEGEMGVLVKWGDNADFLISVGGFHPRFDPPTLPFPIPARLAVSILNESWGKIRVEGYFAVTTNTVQFGAKAELIFGFSAFKIEGSVSFDALFQFDPFFFIIEISGKVSLKVFGAGLFSISLKFSLEGPTPWRATGYGKLKILFFSIKAKFDQTWGENRDTTLDPVRLLPLLVAELEQVENWQAIVPDSNKLVVTLRALPEPTEDSEESMVLHPVGTLSVTQRIMPLELKLDRYGSQRPSDANEFDVVVSGGDFEQIGEIDESFAPAQFKDLDSSAKLSSPAYEPEKGGINLSAKGDQINSDRVTVRHVRYELITIDTAYKRVKVKFFAWFATLFTLFFKNNAASKSAVSMQSRKRIVPQDEAIEIIRNTYTVANTKNNTPYSSASVNFKSKLQAEAYIASELANNPKQKDSMHVIFDHEVNPAA